MDEDIPEIAELEQTAAWRARTVDADPSDTRSAKAAAQLQKLADDLRRGADAKLLDEYRCVCNWLSESDGISDLALHTQYFRDRIGFGTWAETGDDYLRALLELARETSGIG